MQDFCWKEKVKLKSNEEQMHVFCFILYEVTFQKVKNWEQLLSIKRRNILASVNICDAFRVFCA